MRPVGDLLRGPTPMCPAHATVRDTAETMASSRRRSVLIPLGDGTHGIVTQGDLTRRVLAAGRGPTTPVGAVMTAPVRTCRADRLGADALMDMLEHGVRQLPVLSARGELLGVVEDADLLGTAARGGFLLRGNISRATDTDELVTVATRIPALVLGLRQTRMAPLDVSAILSVIIDATVTRALDLVTEAADFTWLSLGSVARREALPASDLDTAMIRPDRSDFAEFAELAQRPHALLVRCGLRSDANGAVATRRRFSRTQDEWIRATEAWIRDPFHDRGLVMLSLLLDSRAVGGDADRSLTEAVAEKLRAHPRAMRLLLREAVAEPARPHPLRQILSRRSGPVDLKAHGAMPVMNIARWAGICAGVTDRSTIVRLQAAAGTGLLLDDDARVLSESFDVVQQIRLRHQCEQLEQGLPITDEVDVDTLTPLYRSLLSEAVREIAGVGRRLSYAESAGAW
ncbi:CBS domain-containing protein [Rhodococcus sp. ABRD24]|nr:CBS domain-containing protein [Rhodococcus sp. ABRD24]